MRGGTRIFAKVMLLLFAIVFSALLLEITVLLVFGEQPKFPRHVVGADFGVRVNQPHAHYRHKSADGIFWFDINARGLRADRDYPYAKPPGVIRIVSLGDSFTVGYEVQGNETFSSVLEGELRADGQSVEVLNAGVSGYSNAEEAIYLERELLRYDPDIVVLSFCSNDLVDNVRSGLFVLKDGRLEQSADRYVPAGAVGDFFNTNPVFNWLSGYSNAFVFLKERVTLLAKRDMIAQNEGQIAERVSGGAASRRDELKAQRRLAAAILDRIYELTHSRGIPLVIQSIPVPSGGDPPKLIEMFPVEEFDVDREGLYFVGLVDLLNARKGQHELYNHHSHGHWTAFAHQISAEELARVMVESGLLERHAGQGSVRVGVLPNAQENGRRAGANFGG